MFRVLKGLGGLGVNRFRVLRFGGLSALRH